MNTKFDNDPFKTIEERAAYWLILLDSSDCTPQDRYAFEAWKSDDPANGVAFLKIQRGNAFIDQRITDPVLRNIGQQALEQTKPKRFTGKWIRIVAIAASAFIVLGVGSFMMLQADEKIIVAKLEVYETAVGERSTITLLDGSVMTLNTNSRIVVNFTDEQREVKLQRGQGFFAVEKDVNRPFVVKAGDRQVIALGTAFDVRIENNKLIEVTLLEGRVSVDKITAGNHKPTSRQKESILLSPDERLIIKSDDSSKIVKTNANEVTSWRDGRLIFRSEPINNVIDEINRYSLQQLKLDDDVRLAELTVSGVFKTGRASSFVDVLERMYPLEIQRTGLNELTLVWQE